MPDLMTGAAWPAGARDAAPRETAAADDHLMSSTQVRARYGGVSQMWLWRRITDPHSGFPQPIYIARRRYWRLGWLRAWEASQPKRAA